MHPEHDLWEPWQFAWSDEEHETFVSPPLSLCPFRMAVTFRSGKAQQPCGEATADFVRIGLVNLFMMSSCCAL